MFAVYTGNVKVTRKGILDYFRNEVFFNTKERALRSAKRRVQNLRNNPKVFEYTVWVVEYSEDGLEIGERIIIGKKEISSAAERREKLNSLRVQMGLNEL